MNGVNIKTSKQESAVMKNENYIIDVQYACDFSHLPQTAFFEELAKKFLVLMNVKLCSVIFRIVDEEEGRYLNENFRGKLGPTNVLSFCYSDSFEEQEQLFDELPHLGDIVFCAPVIFNEAKEQQLEIAAHYAHLIIHGLLHLQGYDHEQDNDAEIMENKEIELLTHLGYANPYL